MSTSDILTLIALAFTGLLALCGTITWFHLFMADYKEKARAELEKAIAAESLARREENQRIMDQVKQLTDLNMAVGLMGQSIEHLTQKFADNQLSMSEVKLALGSIDSRMNQLALDAARRAPRPRPRTRKDKTNALNP